MKSFLFAIVSISAISLSSQAGVECDCHLVFSVTQNYESSVPVSKVAGLIQFDAGKRCESDVKQKVNSLILRPKVYSSRLTNCVSTGPVATE